MPFAISDAPENIKLTISKLGTGGSVTIRCTATSEPVSRYTIYRKKTVLLNNSLSGVLTVNGFRESDYGAYSCIAKNQVNSSTVSFDYVRSASSKFLCFYRLEIFIRRRGEGGINL